MNQIRLFAVAATLIAAAASAHAVSVTSLPGSTTYAIPALNLFTTGPESVAPGITWSSDSGNSVFGWTGGYGFNSNGFWGGLSMIGSNSQTATMRIDFSAPVAGVGAFMNYADSTGTPTIAIYDSSNMLLESYVLNFSTGGGTNTGEFHGFLQGSADIAYMTLSNAYIGAANLEVLAAPAVPEPETYALMLAGLMAVGAVARRRKQS